MFEWISSYNYDYALAAVPIQIIMLLFFCARRNLPVHSSGSFMGVMISNLVMTIFDLVACEMNEVWTQFPLWVMYLVNQLYFWGFIARSWFLFDYTFEESQAYRTCGRKIHVIAVLPVAVTGILVLFTPWTAAIFTFDPNMGYHNCGMYAAIYFCSYFYIAASLLCVVLRARHMRLRTLLSMLGYNGILIAGILLRSAFMNTLVTSYFSILAILVIYLSIQNPDLFRDKKTDLFNQDAFNRIVTEYLHKKVPFHCIAVSLHCFESAKALYGYRQINRALRAMGAWMVVNFPGYYVFYYGNGNFLMFKQGSFEEKDTAIIDKLYERFSYPWKFGDSEVSVSMSAMILPRKLMPNNIDRIEDLIRFVFANSYVENKRGHLIVGEDMLEAIERHDAVEAALRKAIDERRIEVFYQPIVSAGGQRVVSAEALARLNDPVLGYVSPVEFIRIAEKTGDIMKLGRQVFEKVCAFAVENDIAGRGIRKIDVNLSPAQCLNDRLASEFFSIADNYGMPFDLINFEITETSVEDFQVIHRQLVCLQERGATFSLDDFGTGTSNLVRLMNLPIEFVKFDKTVVDSHFSGELTILPNLVHMFHNADMRVVVEGVETSEMCLTLEGMGADFVQGYYYSEPLPPEEFVRFLDEWQPSCA